MEYKYTQTQNKNITVMPMGSQLVIFLSQDVRPGEIYMIANPDHPNTPDFLVKKIEADMRETPQQILERIDEQP